MEKNSQIKITSAMLNINIEPQFEIISYGSTARGTQIRCPWTVLRFGFFLPSPARAGEADIMRFKISWM